MRLPFTCVDCCFMCGDSAWKKCLDCASHFTANAATPVYFCENCAKLAHGQATKRDKHTVSDVTTESDDLSGLELLSVICIETSHYICFTRSEDRWVFFDSMANRVRKFWYMYMYLCVGIISMCACIIVNFVGENSTNLSLFCYR
jgi:hypothetical protein